MKIKPLKIQKMNSKGSIIDILIWLVVSFVIVMFFALWVYGFNLITVELVAIDATIGNDTSFSSIAQDTFGVVNTQQTTGLHLLAFVMIFMMGLSILITNFLVKAHPAFFIVYLFIIIVAFIASVYLSNQYESFMTDNLLGETIRDFKGASFIMLYLPIWTSVIGIFGAIFLFAGIIRDSGSGESIV